MKIARILATAGLALTTLTISGVAEARDYHRGHDYHHGYDHGRGWHGDRGHHGYYGHRGNYGHRHCYTEWRHHHRVRVCR